MPGPNRYNAKCTITKPKARQSSLGRKQVQSRRYKNSQKSPTPVTYDPIISFNIIHSKSYKKKGGVTFAKSKRKTFKKGYFKGACKHQIRKKIGGLKYRLFLFLFQ